MKNLLSLAALLTPDDGNGGGGGAGAAGAGGSFITQNAGKDEGKAGAAGGAGADAKDGKAAAGEGGAELTPEQKAAADAKAALEAPVDEKWNPKLSDGQKLDDADLGDFRKLGKDLGLKSGQAQKLVEYELAREQRLEKAQVAAFEKKRADWRESMKKDPEFGGANYLKNVRNVQRAMARFGASEGFKKFADAGAGDHPEFAKFVAAVGASLGEDPGVSAGAKTSAGGGDAELRKMFDKSPELFT